MSRGISNSRGNRAGDAASTATGSGDPLPMAAPRAAKRRRRAASPPEDNPDRSPSALPDIDPAPTTVTRTVSNPPPVPADDEEDAASDSGVEHAPHNPGDTSSVTTPTAPTPTPGLIPRMGHGIRGWAAVDGNELIGYKRAPDHAISGRSLAQSYTVIQTAAVHDCIG